MDLESRDYEGSNNAVDSETSDSDTMDFDCVEFERNLDCTLTPEQRKIMEKYWSKTKSKPEQCHNFVLNDCHKWGKMQKIKKRSKTLRHLIETDPELKNQLNWTAIFEEILGELNISFEKQNVLKNNPKEKKQIFAYKINNVLGLTFVGLQPTQEEALEEAARKGLEFLITMA